MKVATIPVPSRPVWIMLALLALLLGAIGAKLAMGFLHVLLLQWSGIFCFYIGWTADEVWAKP